LATVLGAGFTAGFAAAVTGFAAGFGAAGFGAALAAGFGAACAPITNSAPKTAWLMVLRVTFSHAAHPPS
jgi:hypothetical protein